MGVKGPMVITMSGEEGRSERKIDQDKNTDSWTRELNRYPLDDIFSIAMYQIFNVTSHYTNLHYIGEGAYGMIVEQGKKPSKKFPPLEINSNVSEIKVGFDTELYGKVRCDAIRYSVVRLGTELYNKVRCGMVRYGMVR